MWIVIAQRIAFEFLLDFFYFPVWWYTGGAKWLLLHCADWMRSANAQFAPKVWLKNLFVPMFGQYDWQGRIVSVFIRFANVVGRSFALFFWFILTLCVFLLWFAVPISVTYLFFQALL